MKIVRYAPNPALRNEFDRFFENAFRPTNNGSSLPLDVVETEDAYTVTASVPGVDADAIEILLEDDVLSIKGEFSAEDVSEDATIHLRERRTGHFGRKLRFPVTVNAEAIEASYENGVLTLIVPKAEEVKPKRISIKAN